jgi:formylglycine-generating enzyme required for sulfatase activity
MTVTLIKYKSTWLLTALGMIAATLLTGLSLPQDGAPLAAVATPTLESARMSATPASETPTGKDGMALVHVPAGSFAMGSDVWDEELPVHNVYLNGYWIDQTEVTNAMFAKFIEATLYQTDAEKIGSGWDWNVNEGVWRKVEGANWRQPRGAGSDITGLENHPVVQVSWNDAQAYCEWAGRRLPTEAEWEKAARGSKDNRSYPWGDDVAEAGKRLNFADRNLPVNWANLQADDGFEYTAPVGSYSLGVSPYGVLDMSGNVWEWTADRYSIDYYSRSEPQNPTGPANGKRHVLRGGSWFNDLRDMRSAYRAADLPDASYTDLGFRCSQSEK